MSTSGYTYDDHLPADFSDQSLRADVATGLTAARKWLPPKWFYDKIGSELFEDITRLREYYPTRTERAILDRHATEIIEAAGSDTLIELGSGSSEKTTLLLDALTSRAPGQATYVALDVSEDALRSACVGARRRLSGPAGRRHAGRLHPPVGPASARRCPRRSRSSAARSETSSPAERAAFLRSLRAGLDPDDRFLLGADLVKSPDVLVPAYDDAAGVTAEFNLNLLDVLNQRLDANFDRTAFEHVAVWDAENEWIEMRLRATREIVTQVPGVGLTVRLARGESIRTEISAKFRRAGLTAELQAAGFVEHGWWTDEREWFSLSLWGPA